MTLNAQQVAPTPPADTQHKHESSADPEARLGTRETSGTAWLPDETPMYGVHRAWGAWDVMLHGSAFGQFLYEPGDIHRTGGFSRTQFSSVNWGMAMARREIGAGRLTLRSMVSLEPWTVRSCGFINLLATGEMCRGDTIHDRQHPHDLFMELAGLYDRPVRGNVRWQVLAGVSGEPALGPVGFPHRHSAMANPVAPISHHWLDSTHIAFGLLTGAVYDTRWKAEMSVFNGREPDPDRADLDLAPFDSFSGRLSLAPTRNFALQVSAAHLHEAEAEFAPQPRSDLDKLTASATYHRATAQSVWATTLAYGLNAGPETIAGIGTFDLLTYALLLESTLLIDDRHAWFGRVEIVEKPAHDLHAHEWLARVFTVGKGQIGYARYADPRHGLSVGIGGFVSAALVPPEITNRYVRRIAPGFGAFVTLRPSRIH